MFKVVAPDEYDEALLRRPDLCPLSLLGDARSGRQLLGHAAADSAQSIASLASSRIGGAWLRRLSERVEARAVAFEQQLGLLEAAAGGA